MAHTYESVLRHLTGYLHGRVEGSPEVNENSRLVQDLGIDSLRAFEIVEDLEDAYQIVVPLEVLYKRQIQTVSDLTREIVRLLDKKT